MKNQCKTVIRKSLGVAISIALISSAGPGSAEAVIVKGPLIFADNAFADTASMVSGSIDVFKGATTLEEAITGSNLAAGFEIAAFNSGEMVEVGFDDNVIVNLPGEDLVVFEGAIEDGFDVAVGLGGTRFSSYIHYEPVYQGFTETWLVNAAFIDLDDFGLPPGGVVSLIRIREDDHDSAEIAGAAAIPEPAALLLLGLGGLALLKRRSA
jgi:hypothetical protein